MDIRAGAIVIAFSFLGAVAFAQPGNRTDFIQNVIPRKYPQLIEHLRKYGPLQVSWITQSREPQSLTARLSTEGHMVIETTMFAGSASTASTTKERTFVVMTDRSLRGRLEHLTAQPPGDRLQTLEHPSDEASLFFWNWSVAIIFRQSKCCPQ